MKQARYYILFLLILAGTACGPLNIERVDPTVSTVTPPEAVPGSMLTVTGINLVTSYDGTDYLPTVTFDGQTGEVVSASSERLEVYIPLAVEQVEANEVNVSIKSAGAPHTSNYMIMPFFENKEDPHPADPFEGAGFVIGEKIYYGTGGTDGAAPFYSHNIRTGGWVRLDGNVPPRRNAIGFSIGNKGYILAGNDPAAPDISFNDMWEYDPATDEFLQMPPYPVPRLENPAVFVIGTEVYICSGQQGDTASKFVFSWSQATREWTQLKDFPGAKRSQSIGFSIDGKGYLTQGFDRDDRSAYNDFWEYDPATDNWTELTAPDPPANLLNAIGFGFNGKGYIGLGSTESGDADNRMWQYDPANGRWRVLTDFDRYSNLTRRDTRVFVAGESAYILDGRAFNATDDPINELWQFTPETL